MAKTSKKGLGELVLQIALGLFLLTFGILTLQLDNGIFGKLQSTLTGNEIALAVHSFVKGDAATIIIVALGVCELISGAGLLLSLFVSLGKMAKIFNLIIIIAWIVVLVVTDILGPGGICNGAFKSMWTFIFFLKSLSYHMLVLGGMLVVSKY